MLHNAVPDWVYERDIDLLLLEEMLACEEFNEFLLERIGMGASGWTLVGAGHSVCGPAGESDLVFVFAKDRERLGVLVENKVGAVAQPAQGERYVIRGDKGVADKDWDRYVTLLTAPRAYLATSSDAEHFDRHLEYEAIWEWFEKRSSQCLRAAYRSRVMGKAIEAGRKGYLRVEDTDVTAFWRAYVATALGAGTRLKLPDPTQARSAGSSWIVLGSDLLPRGWSLNHKLDRGQLDLTFAFDGDALAELEHACRDLLEENWQWVRTGSSVSLRAAVPVLNFRKFDSAETQGILDALRTADRFVAVARELSKRVTSLPAVRDAAP